MHYKHECPEWDYMLIDEGHDEITACGCYNDESFLAIQDMYSKLHYSINLLQEKLKDSEDRQALMFTEIITRHNELKYRRNKIISGLFNRFKKINLSLIDSQLDRIDYILDFYNITERNKLVKKATELIIKFENKTEPVEYKTPTITNYVCGECNEEWHNCECKT